MKEMFSEDDLEIEAEDEGESVAIEYDIASYPSDFTLSGIAKMWAEKDIIIPDYQREYVWSINQASLLVDSFLCGLPVPSVFFYIDKDSKNLVIDGQQRIMSIVFFFEGYFGSESTQGRRKVFRLSGLGDSPYNNRRFEDLDEVAQRKLKQAVLRAVNIRQLNPVGENTSAYHIFERLNTGGTPLKPQEIRNCVYRGEFNALLKKANKSQSWRKIIGKPYLDKHQKDIELLLRVFSLVGSGETYEKPMKEFLNQAMLKHGSGDTPKVKNFFLVFEDACDLIVNALGQKPFHLRGPLNVSALDSVMSVLIENHSKLKRIDLEGNYKILLRNEKFREYTESSTTDTATLLLRISKVHEVLIG